MRAVQKAIEEARITTDAAGKIDPVEADAAWSRNTVGSPNTPVLDEPAPGPRPQTLVDARTRKEYALAEMREMEAAERRRELLPAELYRTRLFAAFGRVSATLDTLPARWTPRLLACTDSAEMREVLKSLVRDLKAQLVADADKIDAESTPTSERPGAGDSAAD